MGSLLLPLGPDAHTTLCVPSKGRVSVSPSPVEVLQSNPPPIDVGIRTFTPVGGLLWYVFSSLWVTHLAVMGFDFYCDCAPPTISLWLFLCPWMWGIFFGEFQWLPVDDCSAVSCDSSVLTRGSESTSFYSVILNQSPHIKFLRFTNFEA